MGRASYDDDPVRFAEKMMVLLDRGGRTATYKFAVLMALMDLCLEQSAGDGGAPQMVTTRQLAAKIVELYWGHTRLYAGRQALRQNTGGQARIITLISEFRTQRTPDPTCSLYRASQYDEAAFARLVHEVEWKLVQMPLPKLQRVGKHLHSFIYTIHWDDGVSRRHFKSPDFDNRILFAGQASEHLARLTGLLRPIIHRQWAGMVARLNV